MYLVECWIVGMSGYLRMIINLVDDGSIAQGTSFVEYRNIQHPIYVAAQREDWQECERCAKKRWQEIQCIEKRGLEEKEAKR